MSFLLGVPTTGTTTPEPVAATTTAPTTSSSTTSTSTSSPTTGPTTTTRPPPPSPGPLAPVVDGPAPLRRAIFPVLGPVTYSDTFGDCRDNCTRLHHGLDLIGVQMQPLVSAVNGTITKIVDEGRLSGNGVVVTDDEGWSYVYYHLNDEPAGNQPLSSPEATADAIARWHLPPAVQIGQRVSMGQIIGWMGDSGNAKQTTTHLHFEIHDPSGHPVNPYTTLRASEFVGRCLPAFVRPTPITSPPQVVASTTFTFPTFTGLGQFTVSTSGGVLADGDANLVGNPNNPRQSCAARIPVLNARRLPEANLPPADAEPAPAAPAAPPSTAPTRPVPTTSAPTTTGPNPSSSTPVTSAPGTTTSR